MLVGTAWLAATTCADLTTPPGLATIDVALDGDSTIVVGAARRLAPTATANGAPLDRARFLYVSDDTSVIAVEGDSLVARRRGSALVTIRLESALLGADPPSLARTFLAVADTVYADSASVTFESLGDTLTLEAYAVDAAGETLAGVAPDWFSTDTTVVSVTRTGRLFARGVGTASVYAQVDNVLTRVTVRVTQELERYSFGATAVVIDALGATLQLAIQARDERGNPIPNLPPMLSIDDASIASLSQSGQLTSLRNGSTQVYAERDDVIDSVTVTVDQRATLIAITEPNPPLTALGSTLPLTARAFDRRIVEIQDASPAWFTLDPVRARVSSAGEVTALGTGTARVIAVLDAAIDTTTLTISNDVVSVVVDPDTAYASSLDDTLQFAAEGFNDLDNQVATTFTWVTPDSTIVRVLSDGRAIARGVGLARVIAQVGSRADTGIAVVTNTPVSIVFSQDQRTLTSLGATDTPTVQIRNARNVLLGRGAATWTSDDAAIARVSAIGQVTAVDTGQTYIRATAGAITDSVLYSVENRPVSIVIQGRTADTLTVLGQALVLRTDVRNGRAVPIPQAQVTWRSTDLSVVDTVPLANDSAVAIGFGTAQLIAQAAAGVEDTVTIVVRNLSRIFVDNAIVASPRVGTLSRPYARIQDAVDAADANDTIVIRRGTGSYAETVALTRRLYLLGDSAAFVAAGRNPAALPLLAHDTGLAGLTIYTSAPQTIRYLAIRHTLDGPAIDANGSDVTLQYVYVNPQGTVTSRIGRGISIANSPSGTNLNTVVVDSVRGYGVRLETVSNATLRSVVAIGVDSLLGDAGAGIAILGGSGTQVTNSLVRLARVGLLAGSFASALRLDRTVLYRNAWGARVDGGSFTNIDSLDVYDNDSAGVVNPLAQQVIVNNGWWGDALGPRRDAEPTAAGDTAMGDISFSPLRTAPLVAGSAVATLRPIRGTGQGAATNTTLPIPFTVRAINQDGFPVAGVDVTFTVTSGGGNFGGQASVVVTTNASGLAKATFTTGPSTGVHTVSTSTATAGGPTFFANVN